jgi:putative DNA primase/helicase
MNDWDKEQVDPAEVKRAIKVLFDDPSTIVELRVPKVRKGGPALGYFDGKHRDNLAQAACELSGQASAVYVMLNPVLPDLLARAANRGERWLRHATDDAQIVCRRWFPLDFDSVRPSGISATDAEHEDALTRAKECRDWLRKHGFPDPVYADSGNGAHLLYRCDLANDSGITDLFKRCMEAVALKWSDEKVKVDTSIYNPARVWKLYGTLAAKGDSVDDRPHRIARILEKPEKIEVVRREVFEALAGTNPVANSSSKPAAVKPEAATGDSVFDYVTTSGRIDFDLEQWFDKYKVPIRKKKDDWNGRILYETDCPWKTEDTQGKVSVIRHPDGGISARCFHAKCWGNGWAEFREKYEPDWRNTATDSLCPIEADHDPHVLARKFLVARYFHPDTWTLGYYHGSWYNWTGAAWRILEDQEVDTELIKFIKSEFNRISILAQVAGDEKKKIARQVTSAVTNNVTRILRTLAQIASNISQPAWLNGKGPWPADEILDGKEQWRADEIMVARNGLIHIPSTMNDGKEFVHPPTPNFFCTSALDYDFKIDAPAPKLWHTFLGQLWSADRESAPEIEETQDQDDAQKLEKAKLTRERLAQESIDTLQEWMGYLLTPDTRQHKILMLIGVPRSGKGTIGTIITEMIGPKNVAGPTLASFGQNFGLWPLLGKSVAIVSDARLSGRNDVPVIVERLLSISGEDALTIDRKHLPPVTCKLDARLMIVSNELPQLKDASGALVSRMLLLRLTESFLGREDTELKGKLLKELPGILLWAIEGWKRLRIRGKFVQPQSGKASLGELEDLSSTVRAFLKECCVTDDPEYFEPRAVLFEAFREWAKEKGHTYIPSSNMFGRDLQSILPQPGDCQRMVNGKKVRVYVLVKLTDDAAARYTKG